MGIPQGQTHLFNAILMWKVGMERKIYSNPSLIFLGFITFSLTFRADTSQQVLDKSANTVPPLAGTQIIPLIVNPDKKYRLRSALSSKGNIQEKCFY